MKLNFIIIGIVANKLKKGGTTKKKTNTRGMLNVKGLDLDGDDDFGGGER